MVTSGCWDEKPAVHPCIAACWLLAPAPSSVPLSCASLLPAGEVPLSELPPSLDAPHAVRAREPASATPSEMARVLLLSFNSGPFGQWTRASPGQHGTGNSSDAKQAKWTANPGQVNGG